MNIAIKSRTKGATGPRPGPSSRRERRAFTLVELLVVIAILGLLAIMMFPSLGGIFGVARSTQCRNRLRRIGQAMNMRQVQEGLDETDAMFWQDAVSKYLGNTASSLICPEYAHSLSLAGIEEENIVKPKPVPLGDLVAFRVNNRYFDDLAKGPQVAKLSDANWIKARADGWLVEAGNNFPRAQYEDGSEETANPYWLCLEDYGGDWDTKDVMVKVTITGAGYKLECMSGSTGHDNWIVENTPEHKELLQIGSNKQFGVLPPITIAMSGVISSYGMNVAAPKLDVPGTIMVMDYHWLIATPEDIWADFPNPENSTIPVFARHKERINVVFMDGSVRTTDPDDINPNNTNNAKAYWRP